MRARKLNNKMCKKLIFLFQDYHEICNRLVFTQMNPVLSIKDHDMVYWIGDLNYRITDLVNYLIKFMRIW